LFFSSTPVDTYTREAPSSNAHAWGGRNDKQTAKLMGQAKMSD
jgi:hypothetical protein